MERLFHQDVQKLLSAINTLYSDIEPTTLGERTLSAVSKLTGGDITCFDGFSTSKEYVSNQWHSSDELLTPTNLEILSQVIYEHPLFEPVIMGGQKYESLLISDYLTTQQFHRTGIYNEFFKRVGVDREMVIGLTITPELTMTCAIARHKTDFTEEERLLFNLIAPHLTNAICNSRLVERLRTIIESQSNGVVALDSEGKIQFMSQSAGLLLKRYFVSEKSDFDLLPEKLQGWLAKQFSAPGEIESISSGKPLTVYCRDGRLVIRFLYNAQTKEKTLLLEEKQLLSPEKLRSLKLTAREAEILFLIVKGKTDKELSCSYRISPRTVQKHIENIYQKLGVETRTAAMLRAIELIEQIISTPVGS